MVVTLELAGFWLGFCDCLHPYCAEIGLDQIETLFDHFLVQKFDNCLCSPWCSVIGHHLAHLGITLVICRAVPSTTFGTYGLCLLFVTNYRLLRSIPQRSSDTVDPDSGSVAETL